jgi:NADH-quinone oxidoreductase subunit J
VAGNTVLFTVFALLTCLSALAVVVSQTVVRMAFWLIISLGSTAALFFLADADFVGAAQLLIYVGGTLVLLVFGVMLTASGPYHKIATSPGETIVAGLIGLMFLFMVMSTVSSVSWTGPSGDVTAESAGHGKDGHEETPGHAGDLQAAAAPHPADVAKKNPAGNTLRPIGMALLGLRPDVDLGKPAGNMSPGYLLPFEIASVHLLVVLIGAAYLARAKRSKDSVI